MNNQSLFSDDSDNEKQNKNNLYDEHMLKYKQYYDENILKYKQYYNQNIQIINDVLYVIIIFMIIFIIYIL